MNKDQLKAEIANLLETITEQFEIIYTHQSKIPTIEMDIALNNIRSLYERMNQLNKQNEAADFTKQAHITTANITSSEIITSTVGNVKTEAEKEEIKKHIQHDKIEAELSVAVETSFDNKTEFENIDELTVETELPQIEIQPEVNTITPKENVQEHIAVAAANQDALKAAKQISKAPKTAASLFDVAPTIANQYENKPTWKDKIGSSKTEKSIVEKLGQNKIADLKSAIGINEKFRFINDLFEGVGQSYTESLERLNTATDINHARSILDSLTAKFNWSGESESYKKFIDLIERRFL